MLIYLQPCRALHARACQLLKRVLPCWAQGRVGRPVLCSGLHRTRSQDLVGNAAPSAGRPGPRPPPPPPPPPESRTSVRLMGWVRSIGSAQWVGPVQWVGPAQLRRLMGWACPPARSPNAPTTPPLGLQAARPRAILDLVHSAEVMAFGTAAGEALAATQPRSCARCGYLTSQELCKACVLLQGLNQGMPRLGVERTRRGRPHGGSGARSGAGDGAGDGVGASCSGRPCLCGASGGASRGAGAGCASARSACDGACSCGVQRALSWKVQKGGVGAQQQEGLLHTAAAHAHGLPHAAGSQVLIQPSAPPER
jgi:hypothetical protein